jgi:hypothetical protein
MIIATQFQASTRAALIYVRVLASFPVESTLLLPHGPTLRLRLLLNFTRVDSLICIFQRLCNAPNFLLSLQLFRVLLLYLLHQSRILGLHLAIFNSTWSKQLAHQSRKHSFVARGLGSRKRTLLLEVELLSYPCWQRGNGVIVLAGTTLSRVTHALLLGTKPRVLSTRCGLVEIALDLGLAGVFLLLQVVVVANLAVETELSEAPGGSRVALLGGD